MINGRCTRREAVIALCAMTLGGSGCQLGAEDSSPRGRRAADLPIVTIKGGSPGSIAYCYGRAAADRIRAATDFYRGLFERLDFDPAPALADCALDLRRDAPQYLEELEGIARGSGLDLESILLLNARSELLQPTGERSGTGLLPECSLIWSRRLSVLAQTWDWAAEASAFTVIVQRRDTDGRWSVSMSEAGMLAKIGINEDGVAVGMNFLDGAAETIGVPIHVLARIALDSPSVSQAVARLSSFELATSGALVIADRNSASLCEFMHGSLSVGEYSAAELVHTNHPVLRSSGEAPANTSNASLRDSVHRLRSLEDDRAEGRLSLDSLRVPPCHVASHHQAPFDRYGTIATVEMNLSTMLVSISTNGKTASSVSPR